VQAGGISAERVRSAAMWAVDDFTLTQEHVVMLLEGDMFELVRQLLGSAAATALDDLTAGIQRNVEKAMDFAERAEQAADTAVDAVDRAGGVLGEHDIGSDSFEKVLEAGRTAPVIGPLFAAIGGLYKVLKRAKANKGAYAVFRRVLESDVQLIQKASGVTGVADSVAQVSEHSRGQWEAMLAIM
jgi:hypothetical protein